MELREAILDWIAKREAVVRELERARLGAAAAAGASHQPSDAYAEAERRLIEVIAARDGADLAPLTEAARLWYAARRMARFSPGWARHGTGPCPEIGQALRAAEVVLNVLASGRPGSTHDEPLGGGAAGPGAAPGGQHLPKAARPDDASFEFAAENTDTWVIRDCEEEPGCSVVERIHRQEVKQAGEEDRDPEPVQVIDVPPDLCGLVGRALLARAERVTEQKRKAGQG